MCLQLHIMQYREKNDDHPLHCIWICYAMLCYAMLCYAMLYYTILWCGLICFDMIWSYLNIPMFRCKSWSGTLRVLWTYGCNRRTYSWKQSQQDSVRLRWAEKGKVAVPSFPDSAIMRFHQCWLFILLVHDFCVLSSHSSTQNHSTLPYNPLNYTRLD